MSAPVPIAEAPTTKTEHRWLIALLLLAVVLRLGVICWKPESLAEDRDLYWGIAKRLAAGDGFANPVWGHPTAYRPPLYPLLLAGIVWLGGGVKLLSAVQITLSVATVWLTWCLGRRLNLRSSALLAAAFVAGNPLLVQLSALAMTETLCAFLLAVMLLCGEPFQQCSRLRSASTGVLIGLGVLCRPTVLAFVILSGAAMLAYWWSKPAGVRRPVLQAMHPWLPVVLGFSLTIAPWAFRNWFVLGQPIVTTTHGGYTLLLGNNAEAYRVEIVEPTAGPWDSRAWQESLRLESRLAGIGPFDEIAQDRWMKLRAWDWIADRPIEFLQACWLRVRRFWNIIPGGADAGSLPMVARWGMAVFFLAELSLAMLGLWCLGRDEWRAWCPLVLLVVSFALVHVVYWSNLRMRAPVEPMLALLAARGFVGRRDKGQTGPA